MSTSVTMILLNYNLQGRLDYFAFNVSTRSDLLPEDRNYYPSLRMNDFHYLLQKV